MIDRVLLAPVLRRGVGDGCSNHHKNFCIVVHPDDRGVGAVREPPLPPMLVRRDGEFVEVWSQERARRALEEFYGPQA